ncbi:MAG TPA: ParB/RepB/Spo0J family partition protein [Variovorax sp.]|nr:ParB/RepB/Spo0J family partition protein [Variovorax sp.]
MSQKFDRKNAMRATLSAEKKSVEDRFATADAVLTKRPAGLAAPPGQAPEPAFSAESHPARGGRTVISVPLDRIHDNPLNARTIYDPNVVKELAASLAMHGQIVVAPAVAHPDIPGHYLLIDGHYRKKAAAAAGLQKLDLEIRPSESDAELYRLSWMLNEERSAQSALDNALAWRKLLDRQVVKNEGQIAELLGVSPTTVNKSLSLLQLPPAALERMRERPEKFGVFTGYELTMASKRMSESELVGLVERILAEDLSTRQVAAIRAKLETGDQRKRKETSRQYKIRQGGQLIGSLKEWDSGKVLLEVVLPDSQDRTSLVEALRQQFAAPD